MKKLLLILTLVSAGALQAAPFNPQKAWGDAPAAPTSGALAGVGSTLGGLGSSLGTAATGIPPMDLSLGFGFSKTEMDQQMDAQANQNIKATGGSMVQAGQTQTQVGTQTGTSSATGMGGK